MYEVRTPTGRLLLLDIATPVAAQEVERLAQTLQAMMTKLRGQAVVMVNLTEAELLPPHITQGYLGIMRHENPHVIRSAYLVSDDGMFGHQIERLINEAGNVNRQLFRRDTELARWLGEVTTSEEQAALRTHLTHLGNTRGASETAAPAR